MTYQRDAVKRPLGHYNKSPSGHGFSFSGRCRVTADRALELWIQPHFFLILSVSVWISYSPSLWFCAGLLADSSSALFCCLLLSLEWGEGISRDPVFTSLSHYTFDKSTLFVHIQKWLSFLLLSVVFGSAFSPLWRYFLFYSLLPGSAVSAFVPFSVPSIHFEFSLMMILPSTLSVAACDWGGGLGCLVMAT